VSRSHRLCPPVGVISDTTDPLTGMPVQSGVLVKLAPGPPLPELPPIFVLLAVLMTLDDS